MPTTLIADNMLRSLEEKEMDTENTHGDNLDRALERYENAMGRCHNKIQYSDGKERNSSFDD